MPPSGPTRNRLRGVPRGWLPLLRLAFAVSPGDTMRGLGWVVRGKRVRGWNRIYLIAADHPDYYRRWIDHGEPHHLRAFLAGQAAEGAPTIACLILGSDSLHAFRTTLASVRTAFGDRVAIWTDLLVGAAAGIGTIDRDVSLRGLLDRLDPAARWLLPLSAGDVVSATLGRVLDHVGPDVDASSIVFWDEDVLRDGRRVDPWLKPQWDPLLACARNPLDGAALVSVDALRAEAEADPTLRCDAPGVAKAVLGIAHAQRSRPRHVPLILTHRAEAVPHGSTARAMTLRPGAAVGDPPVWPSVTIIVPTRDRADLLAACTAGLDRLVYPGKVELIVVDNDSVEAKTRVLFARFEQAGAVVLHYPGAFNFAAMINLAAAAAKGELLCLLNNDVEPLDGTWLTEMVRYAVDDRIGAVGARLLYPNGTIQHVGVAAGIGDAAGHVQKGVDPADPRFADWHARSRIVSAVTAACLVVERRVFEAADGMDADAFAIDFNDVDLCWRIRRMGLANMVAVEATLLHRESESRNTDRSPQAAAQFDRELARLRTRWATCGVEDPHHNPMFRRASERCLLEF